MDRNAFIAFGLSMVVFIAWATWQADRRAEVEAQMAAEEAARPTVEELAETGVDPDISVGNIEIDGSPAVVPDVADESIAMPESPEAPANDGTELWVREIITPRERVVLSNQGALVTEWSLLSYSETPGGPPIEIVKVGSRPVLSTPLVELGLGDLGRARFRVESENEHGASFVFERDGLLVRKIFAFDPDSYGFRLTLQVENGSERLVAPNFQVHWPARPREGTDFTEQSFAALHQGDVERTQVASLGVPGWFGGGESRVTFSGEIEWTGIDNRYFLAALLPDRIASARATFAAITPGDLGVAVLDFAPVDLPSGGSVERELRGYVGPKQPQALRDVSSRLESSINRGYAWLVPLTRFFEWLLDALYQFIPNYGWAIIVLTILVRVATAPIMGRQMKSMERMRALQPKLKELQANFGDDKQKQSEEMMALYRREKVNPLGGCLPMLLQFPVFIGLFYALQSSFELRQAPFVLWMDDLSAPEWLFMIPGLEIPLRVLPLIMGLSMIAQQKLSPAAIDPAQARMMLVVMPVMFTVLFYQFPSGLVLYWMISNFLGIAHQLWVGKRMRGAES